VAACGTGGTVNARSVRVPKPGDVCAPRGCERMPDRRPGSGPAVSGPDRRDGRPGGSGMEGGVDPREAWRGPGRTSGTIPELPRGVPGPDAQAVPVTPVGAAARAARRAAARMRLTLLWMSRASGSTLQATSCAKVVVTRSDDMPLSAR
jgi:hypothetical protein